MNNRFFTGLLFSLFVGVIMCSIVLKPNKANKYLTSGTFLNVYDNVNHRWYRFEKGKVLENGNGYYRFQTVQGDYITIKSSGPLTWVIIEK